MTSQDQADKILESAPLCTAKGCPEKASQVVKVGTTWAPYCKTHAFIWIQQEAARRIFNWIREDKNK